MATRRIRWKLRVRIYARAQEEERLSAELITWQLKGEPSPRMDWCDHFTLKELSTLPITL